MRYAKVLVKELAVRNNPGGQVVGYFNEGEQVEIVGDKVQHERTWWPVKRSSPATLHGWAVESYEESGKVIQYLSITPEEKTPVTPEYDDELPTWEPMSWKKFISAIKSLFERRV